MSSSEADDGLGDGDAEGDVDGEDGHTEPVDVTASFDLNESTGEYEGRISLRAERSGTGSGRIYTITVRFEDSAGNVGTTSCTVVVPKSSG